MQLLKQRLAGHNSEGCMHQPSNCYRDECECKRTSLSRYNAALSALNQPNIWSRACFSIPHCILPSKQNWSECSVIPQSVATKSLRLILSQRWRIWKQTADLRPPRTPQMEAIVYFSREPLESPLPFHLAPRLQFIQQNWRSTEAFILPAHVHNK